MRSDCPSFLELFFRVAETQRDKHAILTEGRHAVTYGQLLSKSYRIAHMLTTAGIGEGEVVGIGISKSADYIAAILGVWISGAAFVPLDPTLPRERTQFIVNQSAMRAVLVRSVNKSSSDTDSTPGSNSCANASASSIQGLGVHTVSVDDNWNDDFDFQKLSSAIGGPGQIPAERLAYIIYTSGSTGRPKGVMVLHSGLVNLLQEQIAAFKLDENGKSLFFLSTNFDASISDIGTALLAGSTLCIEPQGLLQAGPHFMQLLSERQITHMDIPPSVLKTLNSADAPASLQTIIIGGEVCAPDTVRRWADKCRLVNVYGPTEATVCTSLGVCETATWDRPLIGKPIANVNYYLLDEALNPVPVGIPGELYIGGIQVAKGYVDEPELTAKKFVMNDNQRLYRTGDLIMQCPDGEYQFLGRVDRQFKLRGMLVEPEEIESWLNLHADIRLAAVLKRPLRTGFPGEKLIAFILVREGASLDAAHLKTYLMQSLPPWMVPQIFEFVENMPMTVTGKVDLSTLKDSPLKSLPATAPSETITATQTILIDVWKQVLGIESVSIHDDFYLLGGDSLNIVEAVLASHIRGLTVSPDMFALHATISDLSEAIDQPGSGSNQSNNKSSNALSSDFLRRDIQLGTNFLASREDVSDGKVEQSGSKNVTATAPHRSPQNEQSNAELLFDPRRSKRVANPTGESVLKNVFITGVTGFLGAGLLFELLRTTEATFHCLVRANSKTAALERIRHALDAHGLSLSQADEERITSVLGDLNKPRFGLTPEQWNSLSTCVDTVFHSAATVNMVRDYFELKSVNVDGTREVARLVLEGRPKHLHYASTLSVFVATNHNTGIAMESDHLDGQFDVYGGYAQTKFAAELLLRTVAQNGVPISFYRFGLLTGDSTSGRSAKDDFLNLFTRGLSTLGCVPESQSEVQVDITPVDYAIKAMAHIAVADTIRGTSETYHIANEAGLPLAVLVSAIKRFGFKIESLPPQEFLSRLQAKASKLNASESAACLALCRTLEDDNSFAQFRTMDLFQATDIQFDCTNTKNALLDTFIQCPAPSEGLILNYLSVHFGKLIGHEKTV